MIYSFVCDEIQRLDVIVVIVMGGSATGVTYHGAGQFLPIINQDQLVKNLFLGVNGTKVPRLTVGDSNEVGNDSG